MKRIIGLIFFLLCWQITEAQIDSTAFGEIEIYVIDSYISPDPPYKFSLSFFTSDSCSAKIIIIGDKEYIVTNKLFDNHKVEIDVNENLYNQHIIEYFIFVYDKDGNESRSQLYEVELPQSVIIESRNNSALLQICCLGGVIFGLPSPTLVFDNDNSYFSLTKEIPLFSFYSGGYNYPIGYVGAEYAHIFRSGRNNFIRVGYKHIFQLEPIEYVSFGLNLFSNLKGFNGISPEFLVGIFQIQNTLTFYAKYRYNFQPDRGGTDFHEFSIGLYSNFFSLNL